jgi:hypothetical protein
MNLLFVKSIQCSGSLKITIICLKEAYSVVILDKYFIPERKEEVRRRMEGDPSSQSSVPNEQPHRINISLPAAGAVLLHAFETSFGLMY